MGNGANVFRDFGSGAARAFNGSVGLESVGLESIGLGLVQPIHFSTAYLRDNNYAYPSKYVYGRADNPTLHATELLLSSLEAGEAAMLFSSGMSVALAVIMAFESPVHVIASTQMYYGLRSWFQTIGRFGHSVSFCDLSDIAAFRRAVDDCKPGLVWIETPSNPAWTIVDIAAISEIAHEAGAKVCVDSTVATPILTQPLKLGADLVMHSATKYLNGHSDINAGALVTARRDDLWERIAQWRAEQGVGLGSIEAWLLERGMKTLRLRVHAQSQGAAMLAHRLQSHPAVRHVLYPGLTTHPGHEIAARQMTDGFGGMLSLRMKGGASDAIRVARHTRLWKCATSLGGVESLIEHRASMEGVSAACPDDLLRLSVGIEDPGELFQDLDRAFRATYDFGR